MLDPSVSNAKICTPDTKVTSGHFSPAMSGCQAARVEHYSAIQNQLESSSKIRTWGDLTAAALDDEQ